MASNQIWLFPPAKPLVKRFGKDFFKALPEKPGVYLFCGKIEGVLYVGKAKNLRKRISSPILNECRAKSFVFLPKPKPIDSVTNPIFYRKN